MTSSSRLTSLAPSEMGGLYDAVDAYLLTYTHGNGVDALGKG